MAPISGLKLSWKVGRTPWSADDAFVGLSGVDTNLDKPVQKVGF
jgi:hypothetical protein